MVDTTYVYSQETEAKRLIQAAHQLVTGFYRQNNFPVLPYPAKDKTGVIFPVLAYSTVKRFWAKADRLPLGKTLAVQIPGRFLTAVVKLIEQANFPKPRYETVKHQWQQSKKEIMEAIFTVMPNKKAAIKQIVVYPTLFGTQASWNVPKKFPAELEIYLREDADIYSLSYAVLVCLTRHLVFDKLEGSWLESQMVADWLLTDSAVGQVLQKHWPKTRHRPTIRNVRIKTNARRWQESEKFYEKLGINFSLVHQEAKKFPGLTPREQSILQLLLAKSGQVVTIDEIAAVAFDNDDDFSLEAITKMFQRIRTKLEAGGQPLLIRTGYKQGYMIDIS